MIAANYPALGMTPGQSGDAWSPYNTRGYRPYVAPIVRTPAPSPSPAGPVYVAPAPAPVPSEIQISPPMVTSHITAPIYTEAPAAPSSPTVPASAAATATPTAAAAPTSDGFSSFLTWLEDQTVFPGYPNGLVFAGGVIGALWFFGGGKKGRR